MGFDSGIARMGIISIMCLIIFAGLVALIPFEFNANAKEYSDVSKQVPDVWNGISLGSFNLTESWNTTLNWNSPIERGFDLGNRNLGLQEEYHIGSIQGLRLWHKYGAGLIYTELMDWYDLDMILIRASELRSNNLDDEFEQNNNLFYKVQCEGQGVGLLGSSTKFFVYAIFSFNQTVYDLPSDAWYNNDLDILVGINPEQSGMGNDILFYLTALLTFNSYQVFGTTDLWAVYLNGIISSFFWIPSIIFVAVLTKELVSDWL